MRETVTVLTLLAGLVACPKPPPPKVGPVSFDSHPECDGYNGKLIQSGEVAKVTITDTTPETRYIGTLVFKAKNPGQGRFIYNQQDSLELIIDAEPAAEGTLSSKGFCFSFGEKDASRDACLERVFSRSQETCVDTQAMQLRQTNRP